MNWMTHWHHVYKFDSTTCKCWVVNKECEFLWEELIFSQQKVSLTRLDFHAWIDPLSSWKPCHLCDSVLLSIKQLTVFYAHFKLGMIFVPCKPMKNKTFPYFNIKQIIPNTIYIIFENTDQKEQIIASTLFIIFENTDQKVHQK